jgi:hypothetical protein
MHSWVSDIEFSLTLVRTEASVILLVTVKHGVIQAVLIIWQFLSRKMGCIYSDDSFY